MERSEIEKILPHRGRALLLDTAEVNREEGKAVGYLIVKKEHCEGHFPGYPIMRGVDRIEMIALTLGLAAGEYLPAGYIPYITSIERVRYPGSVSLGELVRAEAILTRFSSRIIRGNGRVFVGNRLVCEVGNLTCLISKLPNPPS